MSGYLGEALPAGLVIPPYPPPSGPSDDLRYLPCGQIATLMEVHCDLTNSDYNQASCDLLRRGANKYCSGSSTVPVETPSPQQRYQVDPAFPQPLWTEVRDESKRLVPLILPVIPAAPTPIPVGTPSTQRYQVDPAVAAPLWTLWSEVRDENKRRVPASCPAEYPVGNYDELGQLICRRPVSVQNTPVPVTPAPVTYGSNVAAPPYATLPVPTVTPLDYSGYGTPVTVAAPAAPAKAEWITGVPNWAVLAAGGAALAAMMMTQRGGR